MWTFKRLVLGLQNIGSPLLEPLEWLKVVHISLFILFYGAPKKKISYDKISKEVYIERKQIGKRTKLYIYVYSCTTKHWKGCILQPSPGYVVESYLELID